MSARKPLLAIDTACGRCSVALHHHGKLLGLETSASLSQQAEELFPLITRLLEEHGLGFPDLGHIAVSVGPGSFTGVRIGLAAAQGLALASGAALQGITVLAAHAHRYLQSAPSSPFLVALNAQRGQAYTQCFKGAEGWPVPASEAELLPLSAVPEAAARQKAVLTGTCADLLPGCTPNLSYDAADIAALAHHALEEGRTAPAVPFYLREPDAKLPGGKTA